MNEKGRILVPRRIRKRLGITNTVKATVRGRGLIIEAEDDTLQELGRIVKTRFKNIEKELPALRKAAEKQLFKELEMRISLSFTTSTRLQRANEQERFRPIS